jgi:hypothetical protein
MKPPNYTIQTKQISTRSGRLMRIRIRRTHDERFYRPINVFDGEDLDFNVVPESLCKLTDLCNTISGGNGNLVSTNNNETE